MRKIICITMALMLLVGFSSFPTSAATEPSYAIEGDTSAQSGDTILLHVSIQNNPGVISLRFKVFYDENLELIDIVDSGLLAEMSEPSPNITSPYTLKWSDFRAVTDNTANGRVVTLKFRAKADLTSAAASVRIEHVEGRNANGVKVGFANCETTVAITGGAQKPKMKGDVNLDGKVDAQDLTVLARHVAEIEMLTDEIALKNAEVTGNGITDAADLTKLARFVAEIIDSLD